MSMYFNWHSHKRIKGPEYEIIEDLEINLRVDRGRECFNAAAVMAFQLPILMASLCSGSIDCSFDPSQLPVESPAPVWHSHFCFTHPGHMTFSCYHFHRFAPRLFVEIVLVIREIQNCWVLSCPLHSRMSSSAGRTCFVAQGPWKLLVWKLDPSPNTFPVFWISGSSHFPLDKLLCLKGYKDKDHLEISWLKRVITWHVNAK